MKTKINFLASLMLLTLTLFTISCKQNDSIRQEISKVEEDIKKNKEWSTTKQGDVVYVDNGSDSFFMNYLLYQTLFNRGGYPAVHNHYISTPSLQSEQSTLRSTYNKSSYSSSFVSSKPTVNNVSTPSRFKPIITSSNNYSTSNSSYKSYSTPSRSSYTTKSYSTPSRSSYSSSSSYKSSSYSSPSRSSSFSSSRSFSSPSRSFSSRR